MRPRFAEWRLRGCSRLLPLLLPTILWAQGGAWTEFLANWPKTSHAPITLVAPKERLTPVYERSDESLLFLSASGDLDTQPLEGPVLAGLREARGWKDGTHWILLGQDGSLIDEGQELPKGGYLQSRLQTLGLTPTWEALEQFIRLHPDHGSALQQRLNIATRVARRRLLNLRDQGKVRAAKVTMELGFPALDPATSTGPALPDAWCREVEDTLNRLNELPDPWRLGDRSYFQLWLDFYGKTASLGLRGEVAKLSESILKAWRRSPNSGSDWLQTFQDEGMGLGAFWVSCDAASRPSGDLPELPLQTPSPGRFWPHANLLMSLPWSKPDGANSQDILDFLDRLPVGGSDPLLWTDPWSEWIHFRSWVSYRRAMALASLGRWQEAALALQEFRRWSGKHWAENAPSLLNLLSKSASANPPGTSEAPAKVLPPEVFLEVLRSPAVEEPLPPPPPAPLRFLVWGQPAWATRWEALRSTPSLALWSTSELKWEAPREADTARLIQAGFPAAGWAVFQGETTIVARGEAAPDANLLAMQLQPAAPSRIQMLDDFVAQHPDHLDARRDRYALVKARLPVKAQMPIPALESRLLEDAAQALLPLDFGPDAPWLSDLAGWRIQAWRVVPELESVLRRWPAHAGLWRAWISWNVFLPKPASVIAFAEDLPVFGSRQDWISRLPAEVHQAVSRECREGRRFGPMTNWFEGAWAGLVSRLRGTDPPQVAEREKAIYEGYRETLRLLGRTADSADLDRAWASLQPKLKGGSRS